MKITYLNIIMLLAGVMAVTACNQKPAEETKAAAAHPKLGQSVTSLLYPADSAIQDIAYFNTLCRQFVQGGNPTIDSAIDSSVIRAFTVHSEDLFAAMGMPAQHPQPLYDHIRVYLGYNKLQNKFKLFIVPVQGASIEANEGGMDILLNDTGGSMPPTNQRYNPSHLGDKFVLDLNAPCPNTCDLTSPLNVIN